MEFKVPRQIYENLMSSTVSVALPSLEGESRDSLSGKVASLQSGKVEKSKSIPRLVSSYN